MRKKQIHGEGYGSQGKTMEGFLRMAATDERILVVMHNSTTETALSLTHLQGIASPSSQSWPKYIRSDSSSHRAWPVYVRTDLLNPSWKAGLYINIFKTHLPSNNTAESKPSKKESIFSSLVERGKVF